MSIFNFSVGMAGYRFGLFLTRDEAIGNGLEITQNSAQDSETTNIADTHKTTNTANTPKSTSSENITDSTNEATTIMTTITGDKVDVRVERGLPKKPALKTSQELRQDDCPLFKTIPAEIKHMILRNILVATEPLTRAHELCCEVPTILVNSYKPVADIDARILRTCKAIYEEGMQLLYGDNAFSFSTAHGLRAFRDGGLHPPYGLGRLAATPLGSKATTNSGSCGSSGSPSADLALYHGQFLAFTPFGRLTLLRTVCLQLGSSMWDPRTHLPQMIPRTPDQEGIWREWSQSFFQRPSHPMFVHGSETVAKCVFPALESLMLDFTIWQLRKDEGLFVGPFIEKLRPAQGLKHLTIRGIKHQPTLDNFRVALVSEGGRFEVMG